MHKKAYKIIAQTLLITLSIVSSTTSYAYKLIPLSVVMKPSGSGAHQTFRIDNTDAEPIAVELNIYQRKMDNDGSDILSEAEDDFVIYPSQMVVMPGETQSIRVQWIGEPKPKEELAYRLIVEQLPVSFNPIENDGGQLKLLIKFIASIYITPNNVKPDVSIETVSYRKNADNDSLVVSIKNTGTAHTLLREPVITVSTGNISVKLEAAELKSITNQNILAGHTREFSVAWPNVLEKKDIKASLTYTAN